MQVVRVKPGKDRLSSELEDTGFKPPLSSSSGRLTILTAQPVLVVVGTSLT